MDKRGANLPGTAAIGAAIGGHLGGKVHHFIRALAGDAEVEDVSVKEATEQMPRLAA